MVPKEATHGWIMDSKDDFEQALRAQPRMPHSNVATNHLVMEKDLNGDARTCREGIYS